MAYIAVPERDKSGEWQKIKTNWGSVWERKCADMLLEFASIIHRSHAACIGTVVDSAHFRTMHDSIYKKEAKDPLFLSFHNVVMNSVEMIDRVAFTENSLNIVLDDDQEYSLACYRLLNSLREQFRPKLQRRIAAISFGNDKAYPGIQAADMIAYESRDLMIKRKRNPDHPASELYKLLTRNGTHQPTMYTPYFLDLLNDGKLDVSATGPTA